jgi:hypothetical protein
VKQVSKFGEESKVSLVPDVFKDVFKDYLYV